LEDSRPPIVAKRVKKQYSAKEKGDYKGQKAGEKNVKKEGSVALAGEVRYTVWAKAHEAVDQNVVDKQKKDNKSTWW